MKTREFAHKDGFLDNTDYLEYKNGKIFFVMKDETRKTAKFFTLEIALKNVRDGHWVEIIED